MSHTTLIYIYKLTDRSRKLPFQYLLHRGVGESVTLFRWIALITLDTYLIMLSVRQGNINYLILNPGLPDHG